MSFPELLLQGAIGDLEKHICVSNNLPLVFTTEIKQNVFLFVFFFLGGGGGEGNW